MSSSLDSTSNQQCDLEQMIHLLDFFIKKMKIIISTLLGLL